MKRSILLLVCVLFFTSVHAQSEADEFWDRLQSLCGKSYEGVLELPAEDEQFGGKILKMHVRSCDSLTIKIPFAVGEDLSRTWVLTNTDDRISLAHDHRHSDGTSDAIT
ncbi:MAG: hypothetical protein HKM28_00500, partial [Flavobacteriaceae bacterium]|nr:hypothetical protein [Flavobacteriaceae bacterium]